MRGMESGTGLSTRVRAPRPRRAGKRPCQAYLARGGRAEGARASGRRCCPGPPLPRPEGQPKELGPQPWEVHGLKGRTVGKSHFRAHSGFGQCAPLTSQGLRRDPGEARAQRGKVTGHGCLLREGLSPTPAQVARKPPAAEDWRPTGGPGGGLALSQPPWCQWDRGEGNSQELRL